MQAQIEFIIMLSHFRNSLDIKLIHSNLKSKVKMQSPLKSFFYILITRVWQGVGVGRV